MTYDKVTYCEDAISQVSIENVLDLSGDVRGGEKTRLVSLNAELTPEREKSVMDPA